MRPLVTLLLLALAGACMFLGQGRAQADKEAEVKLVAILAAGWGTDSGTGWSSAWVDVDQELYDLDTDKVKVLQYSYGKEYLYGRCDTVQSLDVSQRRLGDQVRKAMQDYPNARIMVVGHSLGGVVAAYWASQASDDELKRVHAVVTLDSPVAGVDLASLQSTFHWWYRITGQEVKDGTELLRDFVSSRGCEGGAPFIDEIDAFRPQSLLRQISLAPGRLTQTGGKLYHGASRRDLVVPFRSAMLAGGEQQLFSSIPKEGSGCLVVFNATTWLLPLLKPLPLLKSLPDLPKCIAAWHGAILHDPKAISWLTEIAQVALARPDENSPSPASTSSSSQPPPTVAPQPPGATPNPDRDNDGINDAIWDIRDACPDQPETWNNYEDYDGCPDAPPVAPTNPPPPPPDQPPAAPSNVDNKSADGRYYWTDNSNNEDGFYIYSDSAECGGIYRVDAVPMNSTEWSPPDKGIGFCWTVYGVSAFNAAGESPITWRLGWEPN